MGCYIFLGPIPSALALLRDLTVFHSHEMMFCNHPKMVIMINADSADTPELSDIA